MSARARRDVELTALIHQIHERSYDGTYGAPRIHRELRLTVSFRQACVTRHSGIDSVSPIVNPDDGRKAWETEVGHHGAAARAIPIARVVGGLAQVP